MDPSGHGIVDLWRSERGLICIVALVLATVLFGVERLSSSEWIEITKWLVITYIGGKTVTSAIETITRGKSDTPPAPTVASSKP